MIRSPGVLKGTVHGRTIELDQESGLPDGQTVSVVLTPSPSGGDRLRRAFGAWAGDAAELDEFLEGIRRDRKQDRPVVGT